MKTGIIDVGGGFRGIYACGVLDYCLDKEIKFDLGIGVSAGSANLASFLAGQRGRNYVFYTKYSSRRQYAGYWNFIIKRSFIDLNYVYGKLSNSDGENPLDYDALCNNPMDFKVVATDALTGDVKYFNKSDLYRDDYSILKASSAIPFICRPYYVQGKAYYDGALSDPIPFEKAFEEGCDKVVVILTKPENVLRDSKKDEKFAAHIRKKYPNAAEKLCLRAKLYNDSLALAQEYAEKGKVLIVAPDNICGAETLTRDENVLNALYEKGYNDGKKVDGFLND